MNRFKTCNILIKSFEQSQIQSGVIISISKVSDSVSRSWCCLYKISLIASFDRELRNVRLEVEHKRFVDDD